MLKREPNGEQHCSCHIFGKKKRLAEKFSFSGGKKRKTSIASRAFFLQGGSIVPTIKLSRAASVMAVVDTCKRDLAICRKWLRHGSKSSHSKCLEETEQTT